MKKALLAVFAICGLALGTVPASATLVFAGQWILGDGPLWSDNPPVYSGQTAAALLFSGSASQYEISTVDDDPTHIDHQAWTDTLHAGPAKEAQDFSHSDCGGTYDCGDDTATSAYVLDHTCPNRLADGTQVACSGDGTQFVNYAFFDTDAVAVPEPSSFLLIGTMVVGLGLLRRRSS
jgi:hypothetical protein